MGRPSRLLWRGEITDKSQRSRHFYEAQEKGEGPGMAFQFTSRAGLNTGLPGPIRIDKTGLSEAQGQIIDRLTNLEERYAHKLMNGGDRWSTVEKLASESIPSALLFQAASRSGTLDTTTSCGPRHIVGEVLSEMAEEAKELAAEHLPWLDIQMHYGVEVVDVDVLTLPGRVIPTIMERKTGKRATLAPYDICIKATGTSWITPVQGQVEENAFTGTPDPGALIDYSIEYVGLLICMTDMVEIDPQREEGFKINKAEVVKYQGLITLFNRTRDVALPRHSDSVGIQEEDVFVTPEMVLSVQMDRRKDPQQIYLEIARVVTAIKFRKLPLDVDPKLSVPDQLKHLAIENEKLIANPCEATETGMMRKCLDSLIFHSALGPDLSKLEDSLREKYPLLPLAYLSVDVVQCNSQHRSTLESWRRSLLCFSRTRNYISAVPRILHLLFTRLERCGVIKWIQGAYDEVSWSPSKRFQLHGECAAGLIPSAIMTPAADKLSAAILASTGKQKQGEQTFQKGRFVKLPSGHRIPIMELGLVGHGELRGQNLFNVQWTDTNAYAGAHELMPTIATMVGMTEDLAIAGVPFPLDAMMDFYDRVLPSHTEFDRQIKEMGSHYAQVVHFLRLAELIAEVYPDGKTFSKKMRTAKDQPSREALYNNVRKLKGVEEACGRSERACKLDKFEAHTLASFENTTPDISGRQADAMRVLVDKKLKSLELGRIAGALGVIESIGNPNGVYAIGSEGVDDLSSPREGQYCHGAPIIIQGGDLKETPHVQVTEILEV
ncbi:hypothetical protein TWF696_004702 [Orbilia brochopaga]|uniref:Uncharacterized protein n=1 Tax=Orbilia brochopaga TaxID=3140254 RepID=A0AAV9VAS5_9PEZI